MLERFPSKNGSRPGSPIPVIDLFAGPGGLGEGFSAFRVHGMSAFNIALSIEKDSYAYTTLLLRSFFRQFAGTEAPDCYYEALRGTLTTEEMFARYPDQAEKARATAWLAELGNNRKFPPAEVDRRIDKALGGASAWVLIGGPPCQAYSIVGRVRIRGGEGGKEKYEKDKRHYLYKEYLRILQVHQPPIFVMENVPGILSAAVGGKLMFNEILSDLACLDYSLHSFMPGTNEQLLFNGAPVDPGAFVIKFEECGIPQARHRVVFMGLRNDVANNPGKLTLLQRPVAIWRAISDLPAIRSRLSREKDSFDAWLGAIKGVLEVEDPAITPRLRSEMKKLISQLRPSLDGGGEFVSSARRSRCRPSWYFDAKLGGVCNHISRCHMASDVQRYFFVTCFGRVFGRSPLLADFPKQLLPEHENVQAGVRGELFRDRFRVQLKNHPSTTITSHIAKDGHYFIHPDPIQCRSLTVREAARVQTFPDNYLFVGPRTAQYRQVGNAVPPLLAMQLAEVVYDALLGLSQRPKKANGSIVERKTKLEHVPDPVA